MQNKISGIFMGSWLLCSAAAVLAEPLPAIKLAAVPYALNSENLTTNAQLEKERLTITARKGTDFFISPDGAQVFTNTPKVYFEPKGDFAFSAQVSGKFTHAYDGGALYVYVDATHWAKLLFEQFDSGTNGIGTLVTKGVSDDAHHGEYKSDTAYLKITRQGSIFSFFWPPDGKQWASVRRFGMDATQPVKVGFSVQSPTSVSTSVVFSDLQFKE